MARAAVQAVVIPPIALAFSLVGAMVHIFKLLKWLIEAWLKPRVSFRSVEAGPGAIVALVGVAFIFDQATNSNNGVQHV